MDFLFPPDRNDFSLASLIMFDVIQHDEMFDIQSKIARPDLRVIGFLLTAVKLTMIRFLPGSNASSAALLLTYNLEN